MQFKNKITFKHNNRNNINNDEKQLNIHNKSRQALQKYISSSGHKFQYNNT